jgi:acyl-CoA reductase-like NAD-dependent aldehyde dehydrogenase
MNTDLFINNEWRRQPGEALRRHQSGDRRSRAQVAEADAADVDAAAGAARTCFESDEWRKLGKEAGAMLAKAADILASRLDEVAARDGRERKPSSRRSTSR